MIEIVFENISIFPEWAQHAILTSWGLLLFLAPIIWIAKALQSNTAKSIYQHIPQILKKIGKFLQYQIDDPIKYPKIEKALQYAMVAISYVLSLWLFFYFSLLTFLWGFTDKDLTIPQNIGILFISFLCAYMSAALKTQGNRELLKIRTTNSA